MGSLAGSLARTRERAARKFGRSAVLMIGDESVTVKFTVCTPSFHARVVHNHMHVCPYCTVGPGPDPRDRSGESAP